MGEALISYLFDLLLHKIINSIGNQCQYNKTQYHCFMDFEPDFEGDETYIAHLEPPSQKIAIRVSKALHRGHNVTAYVAYLIEVTHPVVLQAERRYRQFDCLREILVERWPGCFIPCLPRKHISGSNSLKVVNERIKYLTHFLNCIANNSYLYESIEFQLFLTCNDNDIKKSLEKLQKISYQKKLERYKNSFKDISFDETKRIQLNFKSKEIINPYLRELKEAKIPLVNIKKEVRKLALDRQNYIKNLRILFNETLPKLQNFIKMTTNQGEVILNQEQNSEIKEKAGLIRSEVGVNMYWVVYEAVRLEINEGQAMIEAVETKGRVERDEEIIRRKIMTNEEEMLNIRNKQLSLKQLLNSNKDELMRELEAETLFLKKELDALDIFVFYVNSIIMQHLITAFQLKRVTIWKHAWNQYLATEITFTHLLSTFYSLVLKI